MTIASVKEYIVISPMLIGVRNSVRNIMEGVTRLITTASPINTIKGNLHIRKDPNFRHLGSSCGDRSGGSVLESLSYPRITFKIYSL